MERNSARWATGSGEPRGGTTSTPHAVPFSFLSPGRHSATDGGVHLHFGAGEDAAIAAEQPAEENHTSKTCRRTRRTDQWVSAAVRALIAAFVPVSAGAERLVSQEEACRREGRGHRLPGHPGGGEDRRPAEGDDRVAPAAGERALGADDTGRSGGGADEQCERLLNGCGDAIASFVFFSLWGDGVAKILASLRVPCSVPREGVAMQFTVEPLGGYDFLCIVSGDLILNSLCVFWSERKRWHRSCSGCFS